MKYYDARETRDPAAREQELLARLRAFPEALLPVEALAEAEDDELPAPWPGLVHRLDRETSGILLVAKKRSALTHLQDQFRERETGKTYLALVTGAWASNKKVIDLPLHKYLQADGERRAHGDDEQAVVPHAQHPVALTQFSAAFEPFGQLHDLLGGADEIVHTGHGHKGQADGEHHLVQVRPLVQGANRYCATCY